MIDQHLKTAVMQIQMSDSAQTCLIKTLSENLRQEKRGRWNATRKKAAIALVAACFFFSLTLPALAVVDPIYDLMYSFSPAIAQFFQPIQAADEACGIKMEVVSIYMHGDTAEIYVTMQDLTGNRLDATTDLYDSYSVRLPFDASSHCELIQYDPKEKSASFLITVSRTDGNSLDNEKVTFFVREILTQRKEDNGIKILSDLSAIGSAKDTQRVQWIGGGGDGFDSSVDLFSALVPEPTVGALPVSGITFTGAAFVGEELHVQIAVNDPLKKDNHAEFYLVDSRGNRIDCDFSFKFTDSSNGARTDYTEYVFSDVPERLSEYALYGDFWTSGTRIEGNWKVTFPLSHTA